MLEMLCASIMSDDILRCTDLAALIQMAKAHGWPTVRIVREMSAGLTYSDVKKLARKAAPLNEENQACSSRASKRSL